jgi:hypothetical protein
MGKFCVVNLFEKEIEGAKRDLEALNEIAKTMEEISNALKNKKREFPSGGVVNDSAQWEFVATERKRGKYKVKDKYKEAANDLLDGFLSENGMEFLEGSAPYAALKRLQVLDEFCEVVKEEWRCPNFTLAGHIDNAIWKKAKLMIRMQSWADFHNNMDGFVPDWCNTDTQTRWGIILDRKRFKADWHPYNYLLFQICVGSQVRSKQMLDYFEAEIQELINLKAI